MITDTTEINNILSNAIEKGLNIYCIENGNRIMLVYKEKKLSRLNPFGGLAFTPIEDVDRIVFNYDLNAWQVVWKV